MAGLAQFIQAAGQYAFLRNALLAGVLASLACGLVGTYVVVRRITYIAGAIAHCVLGGIGVAIYMRRALGWTGVEPLAGALVAALLAAGLIGVVSLRFKQREDTVIGATWAIGMAVGVLFISRSPGYSQDLMSYLFGNILMVGGRDLWLLALLDAVVLAVGLAFYKQFVAVCFDEQFARTRGLAVDFYYLLLLALTAVTVVLLVTIVGVVLVIALLTLPVAVAGRLARNLWQMMLLGAVLSALFTTGGLAISYGPDLPAGATIVVLAAGVYLLSDAASALVRRGR